MAVAFDAASTGDTTAAASLSFSHTSSGSDRLLVAGIQTYDGGSTPAVPTATIDSAALTAKTDSLFGASTDERIAMLYKTAPNTGAKTFAVAVSPDQDEIVAGVTTFTGVDQTTPLGTASTEVTTSVTSSSIDITSETGDMVVDVISWFNQAITSGAGQTKRVENDNGSSIDSLYMSTEAGATTVTMSWTWSVAENPGHIAVNMNQLSDIPKAGTDSGDLGEAGVRAVDGQPTDSGTLGTEQAVRAVDGVPTDSGVLGEAGAQEITEFDAAGTDSGTLGEAAAQEILVEKAATDSFSVVEAAGSNSVLWTPPTVKVEAAFGSPWNDIDPEGFFSLAATGWYNGSHLFTRDRNILDMDTAHIQNGIRYWRPNVHADAYLATPPTPPQFGTTALQFVTRGTVVDVASILSGTPATVAELLVLEPSTEYTLSMDLMSELPNRTARLRIVQYDSGFVGGTDYFSTTKALPFLDWDRHSLTITTDSDTAYGLIAIYYYDVGGPGTGSLDPAEIGWASAIRLDATDDDTFVPSIRPAGKIDTTFRFRSTDLEHSAFLGLWDNTGLLGTPITADLIWSARGGAWGTTGEGTLGMYVSPDGGATVLSFYALGSTAFDGEWHTVRMTFDEDLTSGSRGAIYLDGVALSIVSDGTTTVDDYKLAPQPLVYGMVSNGAIPFTGDVAYANLVDGSAVVASIVADDAQPSLTYDAIPMTVPDATTWTDETGRTWESDNA